MDLNELRPQIDDVYAAFSERRLSAPFSYCACCLTVDRAKRLETLPLDRLNADDVWRAAAYIPYTAGILADLYYLLPRLLEHAALEHSSLDLTMILSRLQDDENQLPAPREADALRSFFEPIWRVARGATFPLGHPLSQSELVFVTAMLVPDIERYLDLWKGSRAVESLGAARNNPFWKSDGTKYRALDRWMRRNMNEDIVAGIERAQQSAARAAAVLRDFRRESDAT